MKICENSLGKMKWFAGISVFTFYVDSFAISVFLFQIVHELCVFVQWNHFFFNYTCWPLFFGISQIAGLELEHLLSEEFDPLIRWMFILSFCKLGQTDIWRNYLQILALREAHKEDVTNYIRFRWPHRNLRHRTAHQTAVPDCKRNQNNEWLWCKTF